MPAGWHISLIALASGDYAGHVDPFNWSRPGSSQKIHVKDPSKMAHRIKRAGTLLGASKVGIAQLDRRWVYSHRFRRNTLKSEAIAQAIPSQMISPPQGAQAIPITVAL